MYSLSKFIPVLLFLSKMVSEYMNEMFTGLCDIEEKVLELVSWLMPLYCWSHF